MRFSEYEQKQGKIEASIVSAFSDTFEDDTQKVEFDKVATYSITDFFQDIELLFNKYVERTEEFKDFSFGPEKVYNTTNQQEVGNALRFILLRRTRGTTEQGASQHTGRKSPKWSLIDTLQDEQNEGYAVEVYQKAFDNTIAFTAWSKNYRDANKMAVEFEKIMDFYSAALRKKGLEEIRFEERTEDLYSEGAGYSMYGCRLIYYIRTQEIKLVYKKVLEDLRIELSNKIE